MKNCIYLMFLVCGLGTISFAKMPTHLFLSNYPTVAHTTYKGAAILPINLLHIEEDDILFPIDIVFDSMHHKGMLGNPHFFLPIMHSTAYLTNDYTLKVVLPNGKVIWFTRTNVDNKTFNMLSLNRLNPIYPELQATITKTGIEISSNDGWHLSYRAGKLICVRKDTCRLMFKNMKNGFQIHRKNKPIVTILCTKGTTIMRAKNHIFEFDFTLPHVAKILRDGKCIATFEFKDEAPNQKLIYSIENTNPSFLVWNKETGAILKDNFSSYSFCPDTIQRVYNNGKPIRYRYTPEAEFSFSILSDYKEVISTEYTPAYGRMPKRVIHPNPFYNGTRYSFFYSQDGNLYEKQEIEETGNNYCYRYSTETNTLSSTEETK